MNVRRKHSEINTQMTILCLYFIMVRRREMNLVESDIVHVIEYTQIWDFVVCIVLI